MGIFCEINLLKPSSGDFTPGSTVSGIVKYSLDKETAFKKITLALKGSGYLLIRRTQQRRNTHMRNVYRNFEDYVRLEYVVHTDEKADSPLPSASFEHPFEFSLPTNIPASLKYFKPGNGFRVRCTIAYNIQIKFESPGIFQFPKKFKKEITVIPSIKARLPTEPTIYGEQKNLFTLFSRKPRTVNIKANIESCVIKPGGKVNLNYEIFNHTDLNVKSVETKLVEVYTFTTNGDKKVKHSRDIEGTDTKTGIIAGGASQNMDASIALPVGLGSLEYSNLVSRDYVVRIEAAIPFPHTNAVLDVPLQICESGQSEDFDDPPSYWEVMQEDKKEEGEGQGKDDDFDDDEDTNNAT